ncbi:MAG: hypothetical protein ACFFEJ_19330 [Candidatus Thorarchaeota archaeon]
MEEEIRDILRASKEFLMDLIDRVDVLVPIQRKGIRTLQLLFDDDEIDIPIVYKNSLLLELEKYADKRVLLVDDVVVRGKRLRRDKQCVVEASKKKRVHNLTVLSTALLIHEDLEDQSHIDYLPDMALRVTDDLIDIFHEYIISETMKLGIPLDVDHPVIILRLKATSTEESVLLKLSELGNLYRISTIYDGKISRLTLEWSPRESMFQKKALPEIFNEGVCKIRINFVNDTMYIFPVFYPAVRVPKNPRVCDKKTEWNQTSLCGTKSLQGLNPDLRKKICFDCTALNTSLSILEDFLALSTHNQSDGTTLSQMVDYVGLMHESTKDQRNMLSHTRHPCAPIRYLDPSIQGLIDKRLRSLFYHDTNSELFQEILKRSLERICSERYFVASETAKEIPGLSLEMATSFRVASAITRTSKSGKRDELGTPLGVSFSELISMFKDIDEPDDISRSLDILLDSGIVRPRQKEVCLSESNLVVVRSYIPAGEILGNSLLDIFDFFLETKTKDEHDLLDDNSELFYCSEDSEFDINIY